MTYIKDDVTFGDESRFFRFLGSVGSESLLSYLCCLRVFFFIIRSEEIDIAVIIILFSCWLYYT